MQLYISKINNINVIQDNKSVLKSTNKTADRKDIHKGKNRLKDLGEGSKNITTSFIIKDNQTFTQLYKICAKKRKCDLVDKYLGIIKNVGIKSYSISNSDTHIGYTKFDIEFIINETFNPKIDYTGSIITHIEVLKVQPIPKYITELDTLKSINIDNVKNIKLDDNLNTLISTDILRDLNTKFAVVNQYLNNINNDVNKVISKIDKNLRVIDNVQNMISSITNTIYRPIFKIIDIIPKFKLKSITMNFRSNNYANLINMNNNVGLVNNILLIQQLQNLLSVKNSNDLLNCVSNITYLCNQNSFIDSQNISTSSIDYNEINQTVLNYSTNSEYGEIREIVLSYEILSQWVFRYYGSLDNMDDILYLNGYKEDTIINGFIKYFEKI